ncbi:MAG: hypothetical protein J6586_11715, partial [Snodgrassella sp.]|nr:hypothetical protein [Snodgrassella sp.]
MATIQAQLAQLTAQLTHNAERTSMPSVPTLDVPYGQGYQGYDQPSGNLYFNARNSDWSDHSNSMWWEAQQVQHEAYWQPYEEFYSRPMQPPQPHMQYAQSNSGSSIDYDQILNELNSLVQGSQNQAKETHQGEYWQPYDEFYTTPPQPPSQSAQFNSGTSVDNDNIIQLLISLNQEVENQTKEMGELNNQMGQIVEVKAQIQEQRELCNSTFANSKGEVEFDEATTVEGEMDELQLQEEDEEDDLGSLEEFLSQTPEVPMLSNFGNDVPNEIHSNIIPLNVPFPCRFLIPNNEESEKDIVEALPKAQEIEFDDTGQATTIIVN